MKIERKKIVALMEKHEIPVSKKGKPLSNEKLLAELQEGIDSMSDDEGNFEDELAAVLSTAFDEEEEIEITGEDPTVPRKGEKPAKAGKAAKEEAPAKGKGKKKPVVEEESDDDDEEEEAEEKPKKGKDKSKDKKKADKPKKEKKASVRDAWNSNPDSSAGHINAVFFANKKKPMTIDDVYTALDDENVSRQRVRDHIRRLHSDEILLKDGKDRYSINKEWQKKAADEE